MLLYAEHLFTGFLEKKCSRWAASTIREEFVKNLQDEELTIEKLSELLVKLNDSFSQSEKL